MSCGIYKFENKINHKVYIGLAIDLKQRYKKHYHNMSDKKRQEDFYIGLREFGWDNFTYEILEEFEEYDENKLNYLEDYYIKKFDSLAPNGYNMVPGGYNGSGLAKSKPVEQYDLNGQFINVYPSAREASRKTDINYSSICACARGEISSIKGFQWKYVNSEKIINTVIPKRTTQIVYQFSPNGELINEYKNLSIASEIMNINKSVISLACSHPTRKAGGFYWSYNKNHKIPTEKLQGNGKQKKISQYDKNNKLLMEFNSIKEASEKTHINASNIGQVCSGKRKTAGGFIWKYS